jgi:uncharacterized cupredoxin-like copper-binding protein
MPKSANRIRLGTIMITVCWIAAVSAHEGHSHYSAGEPGDPNKPARVITVLMNEMDYTPSKVEVRRGEQIRFVVRNDGTESHEFMLGTTAENLKHAEMMKKHPDMEHADPNGVTVAPNKTAEILWKFSKAGIFEYSCLIPIHRESGMIGTVSVK